MKSCGSNYGGGSAEMLEIWDKFVVYDNSENSDTHTHLSQYFSSNLACDYELQLRDYTE